MGIERAATEERLNHGPPTVPRQSASVILLRDGTPDGLELLLVQRNPAARFMGGYWVFPGGAVDADEGEGDEAHRAAAVRELREEAGISGVDAADLVKYSRWITPELIKIRFDTQFFAARAPAGARARVDGAECVDLRWTSPAAALQSHAAGELALVFPTLRHLEELSAFATTAELLAHARGRDVQPVLPRVVLGDEGAQVFLPGEPGYCGG
ncbi:MAG TPA: NUDIX hydrolase [Solirubrobacteraceae bacterium]|nr:NUDIX hydrolase [Solirubrobacteraceae bacterium]